MKQKQKAKETVRCLPYTIVNENSNEKVGGNRTYDLRIRSIVTLLTELRGRTEKVGDDTLHSGRGYFSNFLCESDTAYSQKKHVQLLKG